MSSRAKKNQPRINEMHADQQITTASFLDGRVRVVVGDITKQDTEAIVNAANSSLLGGGWVDRAIHRAGRTRILAECHDSMLPRLRHPPERDKPSLHSTHAPISSCDLRLHQQR